MNRTDITDQISKRYPELLEVIHNSPGIRFYSVNAHNVYQWQDDRFEETDNKDNNLPGFTVDHVVKIFKAHLDDKNKAKKRSSSLVEMLIASICGNYNHHAHYRAHHGQVYHKGKYIGEYKSTINQDGQLYFRPIRPVEKINITVTVKQPQDES